MGTFLLVNINYILSFAFIDAIVHYNVPDVGIRPSGPASSPGYQWVPFYAYHPLLTPPWATGAETKGGCILEGARNHAGGQVACFGGPCLCLSKTCETLSWGPQDLEAVCLAIWVELAGK